MKILVFSDLHLCDIRNHPGADEIRLAKLADYIKSNNFDAVLNLADTVSRKELLYDHIPNERAGFEEVYLKWRSQFTIPFAETAIHRELDFFSTIMGTEPDSLLELSPDSAIMTLLPMDETGRGFLPSQEQFISDTLDRCEGKTLVIGTHTPFPGSCSRVHPAAFVELAPELMERLIHFPGKVIWCGGHFHWQQEPPKVTGSLTALYASRFYLEARNDSTYVSVIDTKKGDVVFNDLPF